MARKYIVYDGKEFRVTDVLNLEEFKGGDLYIIYIDGDVLAMGRLMLYPVSVTTHGAPAAAPPQTRETGGRETQRIPI